jgi:hypothetical protein
MIYFYERQVCQKKNKATLAMITISMGISVVGTGQA